MLTEIIYNYINTNKKEIIESLLLSLLITIIFFLKSGKFYYKLFLINMLLLFKVFMMMKTNSPIELEHVKIGAGIGLGTILLSGGKMAGAGIGGGTSNVDDECKCANKPPNSNIGKDKSNSKSTSNSTSNLPTSISTSTSTSTSTSNLPTSTSTSTSTSNNLPKSTSTSNSNSNICESLIKNGFDPTWTNETIINMKKILKTRRKLLGINRRVKEDLNLQTLTNSDLQKCFPEYMPVKICKSSISEEVSNTEEEYNIETKVSPETEVSPETKVSPETYSCMINNLFEDLKQSILSHYSENNLPSYIYPSKLKLIINYVTERATNEIKLLINKYQGYSFGIFENHLNIMISQNQVGLPINGTSYNIPWDILKKYIGCFGK